MKKTTVRELKEKVTSQELHAKMEDERQERANEFIKKLEALKREYNCDLGYEKFEVGRGGQFQAHYKIIVVAL